MSELDPPAAALLIDAYRRVRTALWRVVGHRGFMVCFGVKWKPGPDAVGEPEPLDGESRVVHVFGRGSPDDPVSPVRVMALPSALRHPVRSDPVRTADMVRALDHGGSVEIVGPSGSDRECDGCAPDVLTSQERWRAGEVRVIRPHRVVIDSQVLVLPLRHVVSIGDLEPEEVVSLSARLSEVLGQFAAASEVSGLSCFVNDGSAARQETPHVHLHAFGRSAGEAANPFELLGRAV